MVLDATLRLQYSMNLFRLEEDVYKRQVEDCGIAMGACLKEALQDKRGIERYGSMLLPMDETLAQVVLDISGRSFLVYNCELKRDTICLLYTSCFLHNYFMKIFQKMIDFFIPGLYYSNI